MGNSSSSIGSVGSVGFIGLGVMGGPMCMNLVAKSGLAVWGTDLSAEAIDAIVARGQGDFHPCTSISQVASEAEVVFLSLPAIAQVEAVCDGPDGLLARPGKVRIIVDMSTSAVGRTRALAARAAKAGIAFVDAPVARLRQAARDGTLSIMVGGSTEAFETVRPLLACMGTEITHCGGVGNGQVVKILNNMTVFITVNALAEALAIGKRAGVDPKLLFETMALGSSDSFVLRNVGLKHLVPNHFPEQTFPTDYAIKDISLALELARDAEIRPLLAESTFALLERSRDAGNAAAYYPAMIRLIEAASPKARQ